MLIVPGWAGDGVEAGRRSTGGKPGVSSILRGTEVLEENGGAVVDMTEVSEIGVLEVYY